MYIVFIVLTVIIAILLIGIVLIQKSKGGGLSSQFGGGNQVLGVRGTNSFLEKTTWTLAALILVLSVASAYTMPQMGAESGMRTTAEGAAPAKQAAGGVYGNEAKDAPLKTATKAPAKDAPAQSAPAQKDPATSAD